MNRSPLKIQTLRHLWTFDGTSFSSNVFADYIRNKHGKKFPVFFVFYPSVDGSHRICSVNYKQNRLYEVEAAGSWKSVFVRVAVVCSCVPQNSFWVQSTVLWLLGVNKNMPMGHWNLLFLVFSHTWQHCLQDLQGVIISGFLSTIFVLFFYFKNKIRNIKIIFLKNPQ
jgi:hypothetical protein